MGAEHRRRVAEQLGIVGQPALHHDVFEQRHHQAVHVLDVGQVVDAVVRRGGLDAGVGVLETGLQPLVAGAQRGQ